MRIPAGRFVWHDLTTTDLESAKQFYTQLVPWTTEVWDDGEDYTMWLADAAAIGGVRAANGSDHASAAVGWLPSVYVYDADACARQARTLGGSILMAPREIPNVGCWAIIADPQGASLALFEPWQQPPGHVGRARRGEFSWHELATTDWRKAFEFYKTMFHWEIIHQHDMGAMGTYAIFGQAGEEFGGIFTGANGDATPQWMSYVRVDDVRAATETARRLGGRVVREPHQVPGGDWVSVCTDPQGATFALNSGGA